MSDSVELRPVGVLAPLTAAARRDALGSKAENTRRAYQSDWEDFSAWCRDRRLQPLPADPETIALYFRSLAEAGARYATIERRRAGIRWAHLLAGWPREQLPTASQRVALAVQALRRELGARPSRKRALTDDLLYRVLAVLEPQNGLQGLQDRALLLLGFAGAFRRSELVSLDVSDLELRPEGFQVSLRRSKTDQGGQGQLKAIPRVPGSELCPVEALRAWALASGIRSGPLFRSLYQGQVSERRLSSHYVARLVKRAAAGAGLEGALFSGHSLRAGFITSAAREGATDLAIMGVSGHRDPRTLAAYVRPARAFENDALKRVFFKTKVQ